MTLLAYSTLVLVLLTKPKEFSFVISGMQKSVANLRNMIKLVYKLLDLTYTMEVAQCRTSRAPWA